MVANPYCLGKIFILRQYADAGVCYAVSVAQITKGETYGRKEIRMYEMSSDVYIYLPACRDEMPLLRRCFNAQKLA